jgi:ethanolamine kinase
LKVVKKRPGLSVEEIDNEAVLLRAYGQGTDLIIDRERETQNHELLMQHNLAPTLLARFHNGMLYRFIRGAVTSPADLRRQDIWRAVARRLAEWHAVVPCLPSSREPLSKEIHGSEDFAISAPTSSKKDPALQTAIDNIAPGKPAPNVWTVMQKWIYALPTASEAEKLRQAKLQHELSRLVAEFSNRPGLGNNSVSPPRFISPNPLQSSPSYTPTLNFFTVYLLILYSSHTPLNCTDLSSSYLHTATC